jgi:hypothetical protein
LVRAVLGELQIPAQDLEVVILFFQILLLLVGVAVDIPTVMQQLLEVLEAARLSLMVEHTQEKQVILQAHRLHKEIMVALVII